MKHYGKDSHSDYDLKYHIITPYYQRTKAPYIP